MTQIRIDTQRVRDVGRQFSSNSEQLNDIDNALQSAINSLDIWAWDGRSRADAEPMLDQVRPESKNLADVLERLGEMLQHIADRFENEDSTAAGIMEGMPWVEFDAHAGSVLGVATVAGMTMPSIVLASLPATGDAMRDISHMNWDERFTHVEELQRKIQDLENTQQELNTSIAATDEAIDDLDKQIAELQAQRDALQEEADDFWNKLKRDPEGWKWGFDDGIIDAPWRTKADALEDDIASLDGKIQELQEQRDALQLERQTYQQQLDNTVQQLTILSQRQQNLNAVFEKGIASDGPTKPDWLRNQLSGCTHYVAEQRDVYAWPNAQGEPGHPGNACKWDNQARQAGYEVGQKPVKGAIVVWEPGAQYTQEHNNYTVSTHSTAGHVAIVEEVDYSNPDVIRVKIGHASISEGRGTHSEPLHQWVTLDPAAVAEGDISFIYDKQPGNTAIV